MTQETSLLWWWLNVLTLKRCEILTQTYGSLDEALKHMSPELLTSLGMREDTVEIALQRLEDFDAVKINAQMQKKGIHLITIEDDVYPPLLKTIPDAPVFLSYMGNIDVLHRPCVSLVGTRAMSTYGKTVTQELVPPLVRMGLTTVSGLALGIDGEVAEETMRAKGFTAAVLGSGLMNIYPASHELLARNIIKNGGLILSEVPMDIGPTGKFVFPARNRIIAGLSLMTVVLEAPQKSGAIITADLALEYSREVGAVPGPITSETSKGCHALIGNGQARLVASAEDIALALGLIHEPAAQQTIYKAQNQTEEILLKALSAMPQTVSSIVEKTDLSPQDIGAALTMLELSSVVRNVGGGQWVRR